MKLDIKSIFLIIFVSSLLSITYNYFSPAGIPLIPEEKILKWASDSLLNKEKSGFPNSDNSTKNEKEKMISLNDNGKESSVEKPNEEIKEEAEKELTEPVAINLKQAYSLFEQNVLFIDAREPEDYQAAHIKNAINIPADHFEDYKNTLDKISKDKALVTYCGGSDCDLSIVLGNIMFDLGYKKIYVFFGGWNEWTEAKYPIEEIKSDE